MTLSGLGGLQQAMEDSPQVQTGGLGSGIGQGLMGLLPDSQTLRTKGQVWQREMAPAQDVSGDVYSSETGFNTDLLKRPDYWASQGAEALTSTAPALAAGLVTKNPYVFGALAGLQESLPDYAENRSNGMGKGEAALRGGAQAAAVGTLNALPFAGVLGKAGITGPLQRGLSGLVGEPLTEWLEEPVTGAIQSPTLEQVPEEMKQASHLRTERHPGIDGHRRYSGCGRCDLLHEEPARPDESSDRQDFLNRLGLGREAPAPEIPVDAYRMDVPQLEGPPGSIKTPSPGFRGRPSRTGCKAGRGDSRRPQASPSSRDR